MMDCNQLTVVAKTFVSALVIPGRAARKAGEEYQTDAVKGFYQLMKGVNIAFLASVVLSTFSGVALLRTTAQTTANRVFKAGFAGFGALALAVTLIGVYKLYKVLQQEES